MIATVADVRSDFSKYLEMSREQDIVITHDGLPVARLLGMRDTFTFLADRLVGLIPPEVDENREKAERLAKQ